MIGPARAYRSHPRRAGAALLGLVTLGLAVVLGAGVGSVGARSPVTAVVTRPSSVCHAQPVPAKLPENLPTAPDPALLAILGVLRRPQVPADVPPAPRLPDPFLQGIEVAYERLLTTTASGDRYFLTPGFLVPPSPPAHCSPPRSPQAQHLEQQLRLHPRFELLISDVGRTGSGGGVSGGPSTAAAIMAGAATGGSFGISGQIGGYQTESGAIDGLVPDGVATVTLEYRRRAARTLPVTNNFFLLTVAARIKLPNVRQSPPGLPGPSTVAPPFPSESGPLGAIVPIEIVWRDVRGAPIKTIRQPAYCAGVRGAAQQTCLRTLAKPR
ncbi:MAG TPA: hypothetical protein VFR49_07530 [Solirubrobacteraceae bacterium]|nr:hypothetical protein [Solirubrobacteraceae bacterium]